MEGTHNKVTEDVYSGIGFERRVVAMAHLTDALRADRAGHPTAEQRHVVEHASAPGNLGPEVVESLRRGRPVDIDSRSTARYVNSLVGEDLEAGPWGQDFIDVANVRRDAMVEVPQGLWPSD